MDKVVGNIFEKVFPSVYSYVNQDFLKIPLVLQQKYPIKVHVFRNLCESCLIFGKLNMLSHSGPYPLPYSPPYPPSYPLPYPFPYPPHPPPYPLPYPPP